jgi:hypothetical protein
MRELIPLFISVFVIVGIVLFLSSKWRLSSRYERKPRVLNTWSAQDHGIDPTEDEIK